MARIRKTLDQLKQERRDLDSKIRRREHAERELKERGAMEAMKMLGLLDLPEAELLEKLKFVAPAKAAKMGKKKADEQTPRA
jgi:hypothetical protein